MSSSHEDLRNRVNSVLRRPTRDGVLVGTLVERRTVKVRSCHGYNADAIIACLERIHYLSQQDPLFARMSKAMRRDGSIDLWLSNREERSRSATFTIQVRSGFDPDDLMLVFASYVPFGLDGDMSAYPIERSEDYRRGSQEVRAVSKFQVKRTIRTSTQDNDVNESSDTSMESRETAARRAASRIHTDSVRQGTTVNNVHERSRTGGQGFFGDPEKQTCTERQSTSHESMHERRDEASNNQAWEDSQSNRVQNERSARVSSLRGHDTSFEVTQDVSFVAVGVDYTDAERLWQSWSKHPQNAEGAVHIEILLSSVGGLAKAIEDRISTQRRTAREAPAAILGAKLSPEFYDKAATLIPLDLDGTMWPRTILGHDGAPRAIGAGDLEAALRESQNHLGSFTDSARRFIH